MSQTGSSEKELHTRKEDKALLLLLKKMVEQYRSQQLTTSREVTKSTVK